MVSQIKENRLNYWGMLLQNPFFEDGYFKRGYMKKYSNDNYLALSRKECEGIFFNFKFDARDIGDNRSPDGPYVAVELTLHSKNDDKLPIYTHLEQRRISIKNQLDSLEREFDAVLYYNPKFQIKSHLATGSQKEYTTCVSGIQLCKFDLDFKDESHFEEACEFHLKCMPKFKSVLESELKLIMGELI
ncbi:hypothetical protein MmiEs2_08270 [Methanimicrococcus stummii]|uniref:Uncharacterized protein n=1 Tax=Methanimicrococcus stummii TaxID=3028294 RepID=A0AA96ZYY2_9EURY|nr:hypothetical protein [Methanimicrococcus sp. Es2]WNY28627.1 hypothetical protein MmiEs2_08270 [Methanimicrococcus sp. Es2]